MPLTSKTFSQIITFTRARTATYFDSAGVLQSAAIDVPRFDYDPATLAAQGFLIEEARTNQITSSAVLPVGVASVITADAFTAPDNTTTGDQILDNATLSEHYSDSSFTPTAATNYTFSAFIKNIGALSSNFACLRLAGDFNAFVFVNLSTFALTNGGAHFVSSSIQAVNNGWYRVSVTGLSNGTATTFARIQVADSVSLAPYSGTGEGFAVWGRQLEAGSFPTSYIPTTSTALTRAADVASVNTLSPWYNASQSTIYAEWTNIAATMPTGSTQIVSRIGDGTGNNFLVLSQIQVASSKASQNQFSGGVNPGRIDAGGAYSNTTVKAASAFAASDRALSVNGGVAVTSATGAMPVTSIRMSLGVDDSLSVGFLNGYLRRVTYYPRRLNNAELANLTS